MCPSGVIIYYLPQVCWYWKYLAEANEIWQEKCLKLGWFLPTPPPHHDCTLWKRHYIECVFQLHWNPPQVNPLFLILSLQLLRTSQCYTYTIVECCSLAIYKSIVQFCVCFSIIVLKAANRIYLNVFVSALSFLNDQ